MSVSSPEPFRTIAALLSVRASRVPFAGLVGALLSLTVSAQTAVAQAEPSSRLVVTGTRAAARIDQVLADTTVIDRAQIEQASGRTLPELLAQQPGVQFWSNGGFGKIGSVSLRGLEPRHTLLLIDGVRYG
jgi:vitamin B12 transporter